MCSHTHSWLSAVDGPPPPGYFMQNAAKYGGLIEFYRSPASTFLRDSGDCAAGARVLGYDLS